MNNFDFLRMLFASFVIITHSYPLTGRKYEAECDIFCQYTGVNLSYLGVMGFFAISGYLIFQSLMRSKNIIDYLWKRALRIFPGLFVVSVLTMVVLSFIYKGEGSYWQDMKVWFYPIKQTLFFYHWGSPPSLGEIFMGNRYSSHATNGSLWTIPYEFTAYILLLFLLIFRINRNGE
ncbi:MAG: acyltransferase, partial [Bergeyella zoohelcum]|nr:acyltransferase [Bergeyella zoohelcum]